LRRLKLPLGNLISEKVCAMKSYLDAEARKTQTDQVRHRARNEIHTSDQNAVPIKAATFGGGHKSETLGLVNTLEKVTPPKFSIRVLGSVSVSGSHLFWFEPSLPVI
jgi:hypothetical protein